MDSTRLHDSAPPGGEVAGRHSVVPAARPDGRQATSLHPLVFSTRPLPRPQQFEAWHEAHRPFVDYAAPRDAQAGFEADLAIWTLGPFVAKLTRAPALRYARTRAQIRRDQIDHWNISYLRRGSLRGRVEGRDAAAVAGLPHLYALHEACEVERTEVDWVLLYFARDSFPELGHGLDACRLQALDRPMGRLLGGYLDSLAAELPALAPADLPRVVEATRALIVAAVAPSRDALEAGRAQIEAVQLARIKTLIRENLRSPRLNPDRLCRLAGVSRSQLYRLFEPLGGVARRIQAERLREAHRALADPRNGCEIHRIAEDVGFYDASPFSRAFRREFGYTPSELRSTVRAGLAMPTPQAMAREGRATQGRLIDLLRGL
jgi:AraC-like DNA-binding protein